MTKISNNSRSSISKFNCKRTQSVFRKASLFLKPQRQGQRIPAVGGCQCYGTPERLFQSAQSEFSCKNVMHWVRPFSDPIQQHSHTVKHLRFIVHSLRVLGLLSLVSCRQADLIPLKYGAPIKTLYNLKHCILCLWSTRRLKSRDVCVYLEEVQMRKGSEPLSVFIIL